MGLRKIGRVKIRDSHVSWRGKREVTLEVTIPKEVRLFLDLKHGMEAEVYVDEKNKRIIYQILEGTK